MNEFLSDDFWNTKYVVGQTGWDLGSVSPPIKEYIDQLTNKELKILIPGCGNAFEAEYLYNKGFKNVFVLDFAEAAIANFRKRCPDFPEEHIVIGNFFEHRETYDLIIEQTLFCAIDPKLRQKYAEHTSDLLSKGGKLVGLFFEREFESGPPFGGSKNEYVNYFKEHYSALSLKSCYNSCKPREGTELFAILKK